MKRFSPLYPLLLFAILMLPGVHFAQGSVLKAEVLGPTQGQFLLAFERGLDGPASIQIGAGLISQYKEGVFADGGSVQQYTSKTTGFVFMPELRVYLLGDAPRGLYINGYGRIQRNFQEMQDLSSEPFNSSFEQSSTVLGGGVGGGYQLILGDVFSIDFNIGPQFKDYTIQRVYSFGGNDVILEDEFGGEFQRDEDGLVLRAQLLLGVAF